MEYKIVYSLEELPNFTSEPVFADIETDDLYGPLRMIQLYQPSTDPIVYIYDIAPIGFNRAQYPSIYKALKDFLMPLHTVWYNSSYDLGTMNIAPDKVDDLFYAVKSAYPEFMEFGLKKIVKKLRYTRDMYLGINTDEAVKGFLLGSYISAQAYKYAALDVYALSLIWQDTKVQNIVQNNLAYKVDMLSQHYALQYQQNGLVVDIDMRVKFLEESKATVERLKQEFAPGFNPNSFIQVRKLLGIEKSDSEALISFALSDSPIAHYARNIIDYKRALKEVSYLNSIAFDRMYTKFNVAGAITGRFTSAGGSLDDGFNSQQIPKKFQLLFKQDTEDTTVIHLDYSTLELRLACAIYNEPEMYRQLKEGEDLHTSMALMASGKKLHPDGLLGSEYVTQSDKLGGMGGEFLTVLDRTTAKSINFGYVFGMSAASYKEYAFVSYGVEVTDAESLVLRNAYFKKYPNFRKYHDYVWNNYKDPKFVYTTALGRRVKPKLGTDGINGPVQGSGAETTKLAVHYLIKEYPEAIKLIFNVVHDAIDLRVPKVDKKLWYDRLSSAMVKGWTEISKCPNMHFKDIPMPIGG
jgi:DNA polymerase-1